jgi:hypothetical protein
MANRHRPNISSLSSSRLRDASPEQRYSMLKEILEFCHSVRCRLDGGSWCGRGDNLATSFAG